MADQLRIREVKMRSTVIPLVIDGSKILKLGLTLTTQDILDIFCVYVSQVK